MTVRTNEELKDIIINYVYKNPDPDPKFCPKFFLRVKRQLNNQKFELIYDCLNNVLYDNRNPLEINALIENEGFKEWYGRGYNYKTEEQYVSTTANPKKGMYRGMYYSEYTKYIPELKMIEYGIIKIDASKPNIVKNFTVDGDPVYRLSGSAKSREWKYEDRYFLFRDNTNVFEINGEVSLSTKSIKYTIGHDHDYRSHKINNLEWQKFFNNSNNKNPLWGRLNGYYDYNRCELFNLQRKDLLGGYYKIAQYKKDIIKKPLSPIEDISLECKSIYVERTKRNKIFNPITEIWEEGFEDESILIHPCGYYYEKVDDKWSVFRAVRRDIDSQSMWDIRRARFRNYKEVNTEMEELFRVYIDNKGNTFFARYSPFRNEWVTARNKSYTLEGMMEKEYIHFYNWDKISENEFLAKHLDLLNDMKEYHRISCITKIRNNNTILKQLEERKLSNIYSYISANTVYEYSKVFERMFGRNKAFGTPRSIYESGLNDYQLSYLNMVMDDDYLTSIHESSELFANIKKFAVDHTKSVSSWPDMSKMTNEEFDEAIEFYNIITKNPDGYYSSSVESFVDVDTRGHYYLSIPEEALTRLNLVYKLWKDNRDIEDLLDDYIKARQRQRHTYYYNNDITPVTVNTYNFGNIGGLKIITDEINRWCDEVDKKKYKR